MDAIFSQNQKDQSSGQMLKAKNGVVGYIINNKETISKNFCSKGNENKFGLQFMGIINNVIFWTA